MSEPREPLGPLLSNIPLPRPPKRLPPIFTKPLVRPRPSHTPSSSITQIAITSSPDQIICTPFDDQYEPGPSQKRVKRSSSPFLPPDEADRKRHVRMESMHDFFSTTSASRVDGWEVKEPRESIAVPRRVRDERVAEMQTVWRRPRRRLGIAGISRSDIVLNTAKPHCKSSTLREHHTMSC